MSEKIPEGMDKPFDPRDTTEATALAEQNAQAREHGEPVATRKRKNNWRFDAAPERFDVDKEFGEYIEYRPMDGGMKAEFERRTAQDMWVQTGGRQNMRMSLDNARNREALLEISISGWYLEKPSNQNPDIWESVAFTKSNLRQWLNHADPTLLTELESEIRKANPWMLNEQSLEDLESARDELEEQIKAKRDLEGESEGS